MNEKIEKEAEDFAETLLKESELIAEKTFNEIFHSDNPDINNDGARQIMRLVGVIDNLINVLGVLASPEDVDKEQRLLIAGALEGAFPVLSESLKIAEQNNNQYLV
jgi:hypothetical protein